jgi:hypothetical protein
MNYSRLWNKHSPWNNSEKCSHHHFITFLHQSRHSPLFCGTFNLKIRLGRYLLVHFFQFFTLISNMVFSKKSIEPIGRADTHGPSPTTYFLAANSADSSSKCSRDDLASSPKNFHHQ